MRLGGRWARDLVDSTFQYETEPARSASTYPIADIAKLFDELWPNNVLFGLTMLDGVQGDIACPSRSMRQRAMK